MTVHLKHQEQQYLAIANESAVYEILDNILSNAITYSMVSRLIFDFD